MLGAGATWWFNTGSQINLGTNLGGALPGGTVNTASILAKGIGSGNQVLGGGLILGEATRLTVSPTWTGDPQDGTIGASSGAITVDSGSNFSTLTAQTGARMTVDAQVDFGAKTLLIGSTSDFVASTPAAYNSGTWLLGLYGFKTVGQAGTVRLTNAANSYGALTVQAGTLESLADNLIPANAAVTVNAAATLDMTDATNTFASLSGGGVVKLGNGHLTFGDATPSTTFSGQIVGGSGTVTKVGTGAATLDGGYTFTTAGTFNVTGGQLNMNPTSGSTLIPGGGIPYKADGTNPTNVSVNVGNSAAVSFGVQQQLNNLVVGPHTGDVATAVVPASGAYNGTQFAGNGPNRLLVVNSLSIAKDALGNYTSSLDLMDNAMIVNYPSGGTSPLPTIRDMILQGDPNVNPIWNNTGLITSVGQTYGLALGYMEASDNFAGGEEWLPGSGVKINGSGDGIVLPSQVLVRATYYADANLDGVVDSTDLSILIGGYGNTGATWDQGDFNGDGVVDSTDLSILIGAYGNDPPWLTDDQSSSSDVGTAAVPEPATLSLLVLGGLGFVVGAVRRRRRAA
jgi:hypothetical protein